ncbi:hypothetical protein [Haloferula sp.]|uniref:hypothetical protein n=1 Tax=Haloferula sp. TaxID=2497595 RepID=UPI00329B075C
MNLKPTSLIILGIVLGGLLSSCRRGANEQADSEWWQLEADRVQLESKVKLHKVRLEKQVAKTSQTGFSVSDLEAAQERTKELAERAEQLRNEVASQSQEIARLLLESQRERREASIGLELESLAGLNGRVYKDVEITSVTEAGLIINHSSGIARLVASDLTTEQQVEFGIDSEASRNAVAIESQKASAYHRIVDRHVEVTLSKENIERQKAAAERRASSSRTVARSHTQSSNPLHEPARPVGNSSTSRSWGYSSSSRYRTYYPSGNRYYSPSRQNTYFGIPGAGRRVNGTPAPTRSSPPPRPSLPSPCPND